MVLARSPSSRHKSTRTRLLDSKIGFDSRPRYYVTFSPEVLDVAPPPDPRAKPERYALVLLHKSIQIAAWMAHPDRRPLGTAIVSDPSSTSWYIILPWWLSPHSPSVIWSRAKADLSCYEIRFVLLILCPTERIPLPRMDGKKDNFQPCNVFI